MNQGRSQSLVSIFSVSLVVLPMLLLFYLSMIAGEGLVGSEVQNQSF